MVSFLISLACRTMTSSNRCNDSLNTEKGMAVVMDDDEDDDVEDEEDLEL